MKESEEVLLGAVFLKVEEGGSTDSLVTFISCLANFDGNFNSIDDLILVIDGEIGSRSDALGSRNDGLSGILGSRLDPASVQHLNEIKGVNFLKGLNWDNVEAHLLCF